MRISKRSIRKEIFKIRKGIPPNLKKYERYKSYIKKKIERYKTEKDRLTAEVNELRKANLNAKSLLGGITLMDAMIKDLNNLLTLEIKFFYLMLDRFPWRR